MVIVWPHGVGERGRGPATSSEPVVGTILVSEFDVGRPPYQGHHHVPPALLSTKNRNTPMRCSVSDAFFVASIQKHRRHRPIEALRHTSQTFIQE